jgi:hypothetical protein
MAESTEKAAKNKKINKMSAAEIETKLKDLGTAQGGLKSIYAQMLLKRKKTLGK